MQRARPMGNRCEGCDFVSWPQTTEPSEAPPQEENTLAPIIHPASTPQMLITDEDPTDDEVFQRRGFNHTDGPL